MKKWKSPIKVYRGKNWVCEIRLIIISSLVTARAGWVRIGRNGCGVQWTTNEPFFSERDGYRVPFLALPGKNLRIFWIKTRG